MIPSPLREQGRAASERWSRQSAAAQGAPRAHRGRESKASYDFPEENDFARLRLPTPASLAMQLE